MLVTVPCLACKTATDPVGTADAILADSPAGRFFGTDKSRLLGGVLCARREPFQPITGIHSSFAKPL
jgi:hypothetical protein